MREINIGGTLLGPGHPTYIIAEMSANHGGSLDRAIEIVRRAAESGANAIKLQTYTPHSITIDSDAEWFRVGTGTMWSGRTLYDLYLEAATPWEWYPDLRQTAIEAGIELFSSPFDAAAVQFLTEQGVRALKIASFELVDHGLVGQAAATGLPLIMSTGMASARDIEESIGAARRGGATAIALLRCNSTYPAPVAEMDLLTIPDMVARWDLPVGLSDHTLGNTAAVVAVTLGASILEKHLTLSRGDPGPDSAFSLEPAEFAALVAAVREAEASLGQVRYGPAAAEVPSLQFRRSLFVVRDIVAGEPFSDRNVRSIRPGDGLAPKHLPNVLGRTASQDVERGTPLSWQLVADTPPTG